MLMRYLSFLLLAALTLVAGEADAKPDDMVGHWSFNEGEGTTAYDSSGNGNDGTLENGPQWVDGAVGGALEFDGEDDYVVVDDDSALDLSSQISISAWVNLDSNSGPQAIVNKDANDNGGYVLQIKDGNTDELEKILKKAEKGVKK